MVGRAGTRGIGNDVDSRHGKPRQLRLRTVSGLLPLTVRSCNVHELTEWVESGDYDHIVGATTSRATSHCDRESRQATPSPTAPHAFRDTFEDLGESINNAGRQLGDWLRKTSDDDE